MADVVGVRTSTFSGRCRSSLLMVLFVLLYSNTVPVAEHESPLPVRRVALQRRLAMAKGSENNPVKIAVRRDKSENEVLVQSQGKFPRGCTEEDLKRYLKKRIKLNVMYVSGMLRLNLKDAYIGSYRYFKYLKRGYYKMMESLRKWCYEFTLQYGIPEDMVDNIWEECEAGLLEDLSEMEEFCIESMFDFTGNGRVGNICRGEYDDFIKNLKEICRSFTEFSDIKWEALIVRKVRILRKAMKEQKDIEEDDEYEDAVEQLQVEGVMNPVQDKTEKEVKEEEEEVKEEDEEALRKKQEMISQYIEELKELFGEEEELIDGRGEQLRADLEQVEMGDKANGEGEKLSGKQKKTDAKEKKSTLGEQMENRKSKEQNNKGKASGKEKKADREGTQQTGNGSKGKDAGARKNRETDVR
ncbi:Plasmodium exported protein, unknown function [Plasmodium knowlesi strain H]|uniref:Plasmodium RESA N-terminal domain-containing protein n=3 Tax=Plasmodium knowlesi TaxID=5850 RepID=A0A5K1VGQ5_PLAKH|nr:Plasmodium exported protein (PHIST), unknown function [Plasmodium knowlesi strain H]OTN67934.1 Uncharacterized protein PKNOH_S04353200 [Plasmodium knowlesi]CAA9986897.1 Plasmodium exported protein (PHIST), unknown function [Plasmodium knowlesi strain H]SBO26549.1 Plasmodium exported protein, unknown function [Plasmodium knowlesi strain H]SBO28101.1 Plasmodium exported protein, unknown function [Plasmodium knowlesi strain H]VVS76371.1 Plasmodium exported protein (PHIST), unknown function [Pl|eukprot:XP_002258142.1 hypothetical protein, conserved in Plasmodium species [Plasmodium knowlesi strain H]